MSILLFLIQLFIRLSCLNINNDIGESSTENEPIFILPGLSETFFIKYQIETEFVFNISKHLNLHINIYSINCNFKVNFKGQLLNQLNYDTYSFKINSDSNNITIAPIIDVIDGEYKENYDEKSCPLVINSFLEDENQQKLQILNKEENYFYLAPEKDNSNLLNILYETNKITADSFISLYFQYEGKNPFNINITYEKSHNQINTDSKTIKSTQNIFLNSDFLFYDVDDTNLGGNLSIIVENLDNKTVNMYFKIIEQNTISLIKKNYLNFGFITSKLYYQYYYTEVFTGEEGELVLHNKRLYGVLYAKIIEKRKITREELQNPLIYPNETISDNYTSFLKYNPHGLQLNFSNENTSHCFNGCYLLITYEQQRSYDEVTLIGYEYTILLRTWNYTDYVSQIVDIPFNEYIIGSFHKGSINYHFYSISIPEDIESLVIQIEGNYIDGFYWEGRKKINTEKITGKTAKLGIISNRNLLTLNISLLNYTKNAMSFAFRAKDTFTDIFSFYYFRIIYLRKDEQIFYPIDSQFGNLCLPEFEETKNRYYCNLILSNNKNYNALSRRFCISSSNQNEYFTVNATKVYTNGSIFSEINNFLYISYNNSKDLDHYLFRLEFSNKELKNIITCFYDNVSEINPPIYSSQMFYLSKNNKRSYFKLKNKYIFNYIHVYGSGSYEANFLDFKTFSSNRNYKGKPIALPIESDNKTIIFNTTREEYIFYFQLIYSMNNKGVEEIISGETKSQFIIGVNFPLYYYLKIKGESYINLDVNLRINSYNESVLQNNFDIKGYLLDEDSIVRKINGETIKLTEQINGIYSNKFKIGLLQVNQILDKKYNYLLIEIVNNNQNYINSYLLVELVTKEYNDDIYFLPINKYILETFEGENGEIRTNNKYYVSSKPRGTNELFIEISTPYNDVQIEFENITSDLYDEDSNTGFRKYWIRPLNDSFYFNVINPKKRIDNYMIRYFFTDKEYEYIYSLDMNYERKIISSNTENVSITLTFKAIEVKIKKDDGFIYPGTFFNIYGLLYKPESNSDVNLNTTSLLKERNPSHENHTKHYYNIIHPEEWTITFENIPRVNNFNYDLQLQVNAIIPDEIFNEQFLIFVTKVDLFDIKLKEEFPYWLVIIGVVGFFVLLFITFLIIKYKRLQKSKFDLEEEMKSFAFSNDIQKSFLIQDIKKNEKDSDYDTTFL